MKKLWFLLLSTCVVFIGCRSPKSANVESDVTEEPPESLVLFNIVNDSDLYHPPAVPTDVSPADQKEYLHGYRLGWEDQGKLYQIDLRLGIMTCGAMASLDGKSALFKKAYDLGREQARKDFEVFKSRMKEKIPILKSQLKPHGDDIKPAP
jgi:hypothetical protein